MASAIAFGSLYPYAVVRIREKGQIPLLLGTGTTATPVRMTDIDPKEKSLFLPAGERAPDREK
jgi:hypothetical protein